MNLHRSMPASTAFTSVSELPPEVLGLVLGRVGVECVPFCRAAAACMRWPDVAAAALLTTCERRWVEPDECAVAARPAFRPGHLLDAMRTCARHGKVDVLRRIVAEKRVHLNQLVAIDLCTIGSKHGHEELADAIWASRTHAVRDPRIPEQGVEHRLRSRWARERLAEADAGEKDTTVLVNAAVDGNADLVTAVLHRIEGDPDGHLDVALHAAIMRGHFEVVRALLLRTDPLVAPQTLVSGKRSRGGFKTIRLLLDSFPRLEPHKANATLVHCATYGYTSLVRRLLTEHEFGVSPTLNAALYGAALYGRAPCVRLIRGFNTNLNFEVALMDAGLCGHLDVVGSFS